MGFGRGKFTRFACVAARSTRFSSVSRLYRDLPFHTGVVVAGLVTADED
jgi:hypothetical protein